MNEYELPLVFFTVLCQWAMGCVLALTVLMLCKPNRFNNTNQQQRLPKLAMALFLLNALGSSLSLLHLGSPLGAYRALLGIAHSWLSREVLAFILLNGIMFIWAALLVLRHRNMQLVKTVSIIASLAGLAAILSSAQVYYQMTSHPLWHSLATHMGFIGTTVLLGFISISLWESMSTPSKEAGIPQVLLLGILLGVVLSAGVLLWYATGLKQQGEFFESAKNIFSSALLGWHVFAGIVAPLLIMVYLYKTPSVSKPIAYLSTLLVVSAAVAGRMLFYGSVMQQQPWF